MDVSAQKLAFNEVYGAHQGGLPAEPRRGFQELLDGGRDAGCGRKLALMGPEIVTR